AAQRLPRVDLAAQAFHAANPTLVAPIRRAGSFPPLDRDVAAVELALTLPLVTGGRLDAAEALAGHGRDAAAAGLRVAEQDLLLEVAATYAKALQLRDMQAVAHARIAALQAEQLQRQRRFDEGRAARLDLMRLQTQLSQARHDLLVVEQGERDARALLAALLASTDPLPPLAPLPAELMSTPSRQRDADPAGPGGAETEVDAVDRAVDHALAQRPELRRAQARVQAADAQRRIAESALAPQLSLVAQASASTGGDLHGYADGRVGVQLAIPIFDGSIRRQRASQAALERDRQSLAAEDLRHRLAAEVRQAHGALRESRARLAVAAQGEREAEEALRIESARLDAGEGTVGDLLAADAALWA
ncbi:MAG: TolC family protein, partial [Rhodoferax sp.]|nr:TolC family protein [Rhodoferax sp.]